VEYCTAPSYTHATNASLWPHQFVSLPVAVPGPTRSSLTTQRFTSPWYRRPSSALPSRNEVAIVQPVLVKQLENDMLTAVAFLPRWLLTGNKVGHVKLWIRPLPVTSRKNGHGSRTTADAQDLDWVS
jgi:hypothetical protein